MIIEYHRPKDIDEALLLLNRETPRTIPVGGGNVVSQGSGEIIAVVDLQNLGMNQIQLTGTSYQAGATATLEDIFRHPATPQAVRDAVHLDATVNTRNTATIAGAVVAAKGESALLTVLLALDARLSWLPGSTPQSVGDFISLKNNIRHGKLIEWVQFPLQAQVRMASVGRSPLDVPFLIVVITQWPSGRTRVALGGKVKEPVLAMDGLTPDGMVEAGINACSHYSNQWISANYLKDTTEKLIKRLAVTM